MRVAVLSGGRSSEHEVSLTSGAAVRAGLDEAGHEVVDVRLRRDGGWEHEGEPLQLAPGGGLLGAEAVFPVLHGRYGEDGTVQGLLDALGVPFVGAGVLASALCLDKVLFKDLMRSAGIPQVDYAGVREGDDPATLGRLGLPVFVKPARLGSSVGISKVTSEEDLVPALDAAYAHDPLVIVEAMAQGMEVECSVLGNDEPRASLPGEIVVRAEWYDYDAKYEPGGMELVVPARISDGARDEVRRLATDVFSRVGCSGMARCDFFVEDPGGEERVLVNELNTIPGFTATSVFSKLFEVTGIPYPELLDRLLELALERHAQEAAYRF